MTAISRSVLPLPTTVNHQLPSCLQQKSFIATQLMCEIKEENNHLTQHDGMCSYCAKRNAVLHMVDSVKILSGREALTCYRFNKMKGEHYFCGDFSVFICSTPP